MTSYSHCKLISGQTIGVMSPSSSIVPERFETGCAVLRERGFNLTIHPQTYAGANTDTQQAGTPTDKAKAFTELWNDNKIDAIMASCGGNFSAQFLHLLDFKELSKHPKPVIGFSDTTSLLSALYTKAEIGGVYAPTVQTLGRVAHHNAIFEILSGKEDLTLDMPDAKIITTGKTSPAPLFAATMSVLLSLAGTRYYPNLTGHILVLEDIGEELSHLDRMLWQLNQITPFSTLAGLIFGEYVDMKDTGRPLGMDFEGIVRKHTKDSPIPTLMNAPIGHGVNFLPMPIGRKAILTATNQPVSQSLILL